MSEMEVTKETTQQSSPLSRLHPHGEVSAANPAVLRGPGSGAGLLPLAIRRGRVMSGSGS